MTNDSLIQKLEAGKIQTKGRTADLKNCTIDFCICVVRRHYEGRPAAPGKPLELQTCGAIAGSSCGPAQIDKAEEIQSSRYPVEKDSRSDCPWKCKSGDLKCLCANQREMLDNDEAIIGLIKENLPSFSVGINNPDDIGNAKYAASVAKGIYDAIRPYLRTPVPVMSRLSYAPEKLNEGDLIILDGKNWRIAIPGRDNPK